MTLIKLHEKINQIVPIDGIALNDDSTYRVDYVEYPSSQQVAAVNEIIAAWPLDEAKIAKTEELDNLWNTTLSNGWTTPYGWKLGLTTQDIALLNGNFILAKEAIANNLNYPIFIIDTNNTPHELSIQDLTILMLQYGQARAQLSTKYSSIAQAISAATSIEQVNNISVIL